MASTVTTAQRSPNGSHAIWKCFPPAYVMDADQQRNASRNRKRNRSRNQNLSHSYDRTPHQWPDDSIERPATAHPTTSYGLNHTLRPTRSRSKLQKPSSQRSLKESASVAAMSHPVSHSRGFSADQRDITALPQLPDQAIPNRRSSLPRKPVPGNADRPRSKQGEDLRSPPPTRGQLPVRSPKSSTARYNRGDSDSEGSSSSESSRSPVNSSRTPRHQPLAANDPYPLNPAYHIPTSSFGDGSSNEKAYLASEKGGNALLPAGFRPGKTEHTYVEEVMVPAVTHEVIKHNKTEVVQEAITRDIHVHHHFTYTQPVTTIEILPARHFIIDEQTGAKVEIPAPEGWVMPSNMQPYKPDMRGLAAEERHYLVDEEHPTGIPEPAPADFQIKHIRPVLGKKSSTTGRWKPFPTMR